MMNDGAILLVEDDENDVFFFKRAAQRAGLANPIMVARDGREAIDYLSGKETFADRTKHPLPALIVLDLNLPHRNGLDVLRWIRSHAPTQTVIVVVLTSSSAERDIYEAYLLGANSYLVKPNHPDRVVDLLQAIRAYWLSQNQPAPRDGHERFGAADSST